MKNLIKRPVIIFRNKNKKNISIKNGIIKDFMKTKSRHGKKKYKIL